jgi:hypothetical protein
VKEKVAPFEFEGEVVIGSALPDTVVLHPLPEVVVTRSPELKEYEYVMIGTRIAVVEPKTRKVVTFVED